MGSHALGHEQHQGREPASGTHPACGNRLDRVDVPPDESHLPGSSVRLRVAPPPPPGAGASGGGWLYTDYAGFMPLWVLGLPQGMSNLL